MCDSKSGFVGDYCGEAFYCIQCDGAWCLSLRAIWRDLFSWKTVVCGLVCYAVLLDIRQPVPGVLIEESCTDHGNGAKKKMSEERQGYFVENHK